MRQKRHRVTTAVPETNYLDLRLYCEMHGVSINSAMNDALYQFLTSWKTKSAATQRREVKLKDG